MADTPLYLQDHFREQVKDTFEASIQQTVSKFGDAGMIDPDWTSDQVVFRSRNTASFVETTGQRGGQTQQSEFTAGFRSGFKRDFECGVVFDKNDARKLASANLPTSEVQQDMVSAWRRKMDDVFIDAAHALSLGGPKPYITPAASLPSDMQIPVTWDRVTDPATTNSNLTYWKISEAIARMEIADVDLDGEMTCLAISPKMKQAWLAYAASAPNDMWAKLISAWISKPSEGLFGAKVIVTNKLRTSVGNQAALLFTKRAFRLSSPTYDVRIDTLPKDRHALQIAAYANQGCVRRYDELVKLIWCDPTKPIA
jgi:hypothetical protein